MRVAADPVPADADTAIEALYRAHYAQLVRVATALGGDVGPAEDRVQDAFAQLYRRWHTLRDPNKALAYLRRAVVNDTRSGLRQLRVARRHARPPEPPAASAEEAVLLAAEHQTVLTALDRLPRRQRQVLVLRYYGDLAELDIANALGVTPSSVRSHVSRGLAALRLLVEEADR